jgi:hypothetical protein
LKGNQSYEAEDGNDDMAMCCVLFAWLTTQPYLKEITNVDIRMQIYEQNEKMLEQQMLPFGLMSTGDDTHDEEVNEPLFEGGPKDDFWVAQKRGFFEGNF